MITVTVSYPNIEGGKFDQAYYMQSHMRKVASLIGPDLLGVTVEQGISGVPSGAPAPYCMIARLEFVSMAGFESYFAANGEALLADIPNYTNIQPVIQISQVLELV